MKTARRHYVICIAAKDAEDLEPRKVYEVLDDPAAEAHGQVRVVDESGEDYLYPKDWFVSVEVAANDEGALQAISPLLTKTR